LIYNVPFTHTDVDAQPRKVMGRKEGFMALTENGMDTTMLVSPTGATAVATDSLVAETVGLAYCFSSHSVTVALALVALAAVMAQ
jgi:hypothetical protein